MELEIWKIFTSLGVPGLALGVFYMLLKNFQWKFPAVPRVWVGPLILLFMLLVGSITFYALTLWAPEKQHKATNTDSDKSNKLINNQKSNSKIQFHNIATIPVGELSYYPYSVIDLNPQSGFMYASSKSNDKQYLKVISLANNSITHSIELKRKPEAIFSSKDGKFLFVLLTIDYSAVKHVDQKVDNEILVFNGHYLDLVRTLKIKTHQGERLTKGVSVGGQLYLTQLSMNSSLYIVNSQNGEVVKIIPIGQYPSDLIISPDNTRAYVSTQNMVIELKTSSLMKIETYRFYDRINQIDIDFRNAILFVSHWEGGLSSMDMSSKTIKKHPDIHSWGIKTGYGGQYIYCVDSVSGKLNAFNTINFKLAGSSQIGASPKAIVVNEKDNKIDITNTDDDTISVVKISEAQT